VEEWERRAWQAAGAALGSHIITRVAQRKDRRARSRKRRQQAGAQQRSGTGTATATAPEPTKEFRETVRSARERKPSKPPSKREQRELERPKPPWHPLPLAELFIIVGAVALVYGFVSKRTAPLYVGGLVVAIGTIDFTLREHMSGFRSHSVLLAVLPAVIVHTSVVLVVLAVTGHISKQLTIVLLATDAVIFTVLFRVLRLRFLDAKHRRELAR
jgi:hypothetical protein